MAVSKTDTVFVAGHRGMVGSAIYRKLKKERFTNLLTQTRKELDLRNQSAVNRFIKNSKPDVVIIAAAKVGGILANDRYPYSFLHENLIIEDNLIHASHENKVKKLIFLGSSCIYPKFAGQPIREDSLLTGDLEPTNQWYAIAKIAGVKLVEALRKQYGRDYISMMPTNLYGPGDNFDLETSHVLPAMLRKFHEAAMNSHEPVTLWGTGTPKREFLHVEDLADAVYFALRNKMSDHLYNIGTGKDISISKLAERIQNITGHRGEIIWDTDKPDGTPRKLLDTSRMTAEGWTHSINLDEGLQKTYRWFVDNIENIREVNMT
jgi:GDP-L-fucose synthase